MKKFPKENAISRSVRPAWQVLDTSNWPEIPMEYTQDTGLFLRHKYHTLDSADWRISLRFQMNKAQSEDLNLMVVRAYRLALETIAGRAEQELSTLARQVLAEHDALLEEAKKQVLLRLAGDENLKTEAEKSEKLANVQLALQGGEIEDNDLRCFLKDEDNLERALDSDFLVRDAIFLIFKARKLRGAVESQNAAEAAACAFQVGQFVTRLAVGPGERDALSGVKVREAGENSGRAIAPTLIAAWQAQAEELWKEKPGLTRANVAYIISRKLPGGKSETIRKKIVRPH